MKNFSIGKEILQILVDADIPTLKNKIFPLIAVPNTTFPFLVYRRIGYRPQDNKDYRGEIVVMEMNIASETYAEGVDVANKVADTLIGKETDLIQDINLTNVSELYLQDTFIQNIQFEIEIKD